VTFVFLAILVVAWVIVFLPAVQRAARQTPLRSAEHFRRGMQVIAPAYERVRVEQLHRRRVAVARVAGPSARQERPSRPHHPSRPRRNAPARVARDPAAAARRQLHRQALCVLLTLAAWSAIAAIFLGGLFWELHVALDASIGLYAIYLVEEKRRAAERRAKVRPLRKPAARASVAAPGARPGDIRLFDGLGAVEEG